METVCVRIKPFNEKKGYKIRRYIAFGLRFDESAGWYKVPRVLKVDGRTIDVAAYLAQVRNDNDDEESPLAFDVMSEAEARETDAKERKALQMKAKAKAARTIDLTSDEMNPREMVSKASYIEESDDDDDDDDVAPVVEEPTAKKRGRPKKQ